MSNELVEILRREAPAATRAPRLVRDVRPVIRAWIAGDLERWPGLRAAHFVGGITSMPEDAQFPSHKDVDLHLVFEEGSPALAPAGPFLDVVEEEYEGLLIEAGIKPIAEYASPETVLANPEIAHHLALDSVVYDPDGVLGRLEAPVRREFARRHWVEARLDHEQRGLAAAMELLTMSRAMYGASGELNLLGYSFTFISAMFDVATLKPPSTGSGFPLRMRGVLEQHGRRDLYEEYLAVLGLSELAPERVEHHLRVGSEAFDIAARVRRTPHPFQHKLKAHLRPYFVGSCRALFDAGHHREAANWLSPFFSSSLDVIIADGDERDKRRFSSAYEAFLADLGKSSEAARSSHLQRAVRLHRECRDLAARIVAERH
jgi:hypothetical protein